MKKYAITYTETYVHTFDVYAENPEQAEELAHKMIAAEEIDLSKGFCSGSEMSCMDDGVTLIPATEDYLLSMTCGDTLYLEDGSIIEVDCVVDDGELGLVVHDTAGEAHIPEELYLKLI